LIEENLGAITHDATKIASFLLEGNEQPDEDFQAPEHLRDNLEEFIKFLRSRKEKETNLRTAN
jgi:hypothetical protein